MIEITTFQELRNQYEELFTGEMCASNCAILKDDEVLFEKQFDILKNIESGVTDNNLKEEIKDNFIIFSGGIDNRIPINFGSINNINYVKIAGRDGYSVALEDLYYKVILVKEENVVVLNFSLFDNLIDNKYTSKLDNEAWSKILDDFPSFIAGTSNNLGIIDSKDKTSAKNKIRIYDQVLSTFQFLPDTSDWQTYTNNDIKISFKYPDSWGPIETNTEPFSKDVEKGENIEIVFRGAGNSYSVSSASYH